MNWRHFLSIQLFSILFVFSSNQEVHCEDYILCKRDAQITPVDPDFDSASKCYGSVKLQGIMYKCGKESEAGTLPSDFLIELNAKAKVECENYCQNRGSSCHGRYEAAPKCAFTIPANKTLNFGVNMAPCSPNCEGRAFIYCSLYRASFLRVQEEFFKDKKPNCYCQTRRK